MVESSESSECIIPNLDILYEEEMEIESQEKMFLHFLEQKQLDEYIKDEEEYDKYEEEMMKIYNNKDDVNYKLEEESSEESSYESSEESFYNENKKKSKKKVKTRLNQILDNKFVLFLGAYLIYEIIGY